MRIAIVTGIPFMLQRAKVQKFGAILITGGFIMRLSGLVSHFLVIQGVNRRLFSYSVMGECKQIAGALSERIAECGTHEELIQNNGLYRRYMEIRESADGWKL